MLNEPLRHLVKQSVLYTCVLSQPFIFYANIHELPNEQMAEAKQLSYHDQTTIALQQKHLKLTPPDEQTGHKYVLLKNDAHRDFQIHNHLKTVKQDNQKILNTTINNKDDQYRRKLRNMSESVKPTMDTDQVKILQKALDHFGYYQGDIDGLYGPLTQKAVELAEDEFDMELIRHETSRDVYENEQNSESDNNRQIKQENKTQTDQPKNETAQPEQTKDKVSTANQKAKKVGKQDKQHKQAIQTARKQIGTPYDWSGESPDGFDCSGFIQYIFQTEGTTVPRTVNDMWNFTAQVDSPSIGDLVFFETYKPGPSHMGIYIGDDQFIHAGESRGVEKSRLSNSYWEERYIGAGRVQ